jgi:energy-coupling factor transport system substrate-specific component
MNVTMGALATMLRLPLYLDSIGTVLIASLFGWWYGVIVGITGLAVLSLTIMPTGIAYAGTAVTIAAVASLMARFGFLRTTKATVLGGILIGLSSAFASVPVTTLFGGFSLAGSDAITAIFKTAGLPLWQSVLFGSLVTDIIDKILTVVICLALFRSLPQRILDRFPHGPTAL